MNSPDKVASTLHEVTAQKAGAKAVWETFLVTKQQQCIDHKGEKLKLPYTWLCKVLSLPFQQEEQLVHSFSSSRPRFLFHLLIYSRVKPGDSLSPLIPSYGFFLHNKLTRRRNLVSRISLSQHILDWYGWCSTKHVFLQLNSNQLILLFHDDV